MAAGHCRSLSSFQLWAARAEGWRGAGPRGVLGGLPSCPSCISCAGFSPSHLREPDSPFSSSVRLSVPTPGSPVGGRASPCETAGA